MTVYREKHPRTGKTFFRIDVLWTAPDGTVKRIRRNSPINTMRGAEQYERDVRKALADGTWGKRRREEVPTIAEFKKRYFDSHVSGLKASTRDGYEAIWRDHILPSLGDIKITELSAERAQKFAAELRDKGRKPKTVNNVLSALRKALDVAVEWGVAKRVEIPRMSWSKVGKQKFDFLTFDEADRLRAAVEEQPFASMIVLALMTGMRQGELIALQWDDVSLSSQRLTVSRSAWQGIEDVPKNHKVRHIPLNQHAVDALQSVSRKGAYVFQVNGRSLTKGECKWPLYSAAKRAGLRRVGWHVLRHTFASHLVMRGASLRAVQELMGHATLEMTTRYAHLAPGYLQSAVDALVCPPNALPNASE